MFKILEIFWVLLFHELVFAVITLWHVCTMKKGYTTRHLSQWHTIKMPNLALSFMEIWQHFIIHFGTKH